MHCSSWVRHTHGRVDFSNGDGITGREQSGASSRTSSRTLPGVAVETLYYMAEIAVDFWTSRWEGGWLFSVCLLTLYFT